MARDSAEPVVVTGCGWVTPFAHGSISDVLAEAKRGRAEPVAEQGFRPVGDNTRDGFPHFKGELRNDRSAWITAAALEHARRDATLAADSYPVQRVGMVLGCAFAGQLGMVAFANEVRAQSARFVSPLHFPQTVGNYISGALARAYGLCGPNSTVACGGASSLEAIVDAARLISAEDADLVFAGGTEQLSTELAQGVGGDGPPLSEGACLFAIERADRAAARGARVLATITSWTQSDDADAARDAGVRISEPWPGAVGSMVIEHWVGRCLGVVGAAAMAAAIGAAAGQAVPIVESIQGADPTVHIGTTEPPNRDRRGATSTLILANSDTGHRHALEIRIPISP